MRIALSLKSGQRLDAAEEPTAIRSIAVYGEIDRYQLWLLSIPWQMSIVVFFITKTRRTSHVETEL
jgi:hypothetical protein